MATAGNHKDDQAATGVWEPPPPSGSAWPGKPPAGAAQPSARQGTPASGPYSQAASHPYGQGSRSQRAGGYSVGPQAARPDQSVSSDEFADLCRTIGASVAKVSDAVSQAISASMSSGVKSAKNAKAKAPSNPTGARPKAPTHPNAGKSYSAPPTGSPLDAIQQLSAKAGAKAELKRRDALINARFKKSGGLQASGVFMTAVGGACTLMFSGILAGVVATADMTAGGGAVVGAILAGGFLAGSAALLIAGIRQLRLAGKLQSLRRIFGTREACSIDELASQLHQSSRKTLAQARQVLRRGLLPQGHIDDEGTTLMVTDAAYHHYRQLQASRRETTQPHGRAVITSVTDVPAKGQTASDEGAPLPSKARAFVKEGRAYLAQLRQLDSDIADVAVSAKIASIEQVVAKILDRAAESPDVVDDLGRLMDYYLPTTVKLLQAYDNLEEQPVQGENIATSRREIEQTLDVLQSAFEKLLDATFEDLSFDVSSDISVLNTILAQEGLTESPFSPSTERKPQ
uniref:5-bromo-4-chloroindolyl phosphate hydrolysis protein n=1 Tax=Muribaculaceae bacterium Z82 TaxID=2304548 RepID=A0A7C9NZG3_9BACT